MAEQNLKLNVKADVSQAMAQIQALSRAIGALGGVSDKLSRYVEKAASAVEGGFKSTSTKKVDSALQATVANLNDVKTTADTAAASMQSMVNVPDAGTAQEAAADAVVPIEEELGLTKEYFEALGTILPLQTKFGSSLNDLSKEFMHAATHAQGLNGSLSHLLNQFKRIALYRFFKSILKGITDSFRIGTQNLVQYSAAMNGLDAAAANPTMSQYATQLLYVRNSVAAAAMPALQALLPVIQTVANWFVTAANAVNQFISALQGKSTFTKAKEYAVDYAESIGGVGSAASKAAKQLQQLMSFDEINNIISPKDSGGGGGGGAAALQDATEMFEEAVLSEKFKKIADTAKKIYDTFKELLPLVKIIGAAILAWKLGSALLTGLSTLWNLAGLKGLTTGLVLTIAGVAIAYEGGKLIANEETRLIGIISSALGTLAAGIGGKLLLGAFGVAAPWGFAIGITLGIVATIAGIVIGGINKRFEESELAAYLQEINDACAIIVDSTTQALEGLRRKVSEVDEITNKADVAKALTDRLYEIIDSGDRSSVSLTQIKAITQELNSLGLGDLKVEYNELTGTINLTKEEIYATIEAYEKQAKAAAYLSLVEEASKALAQATVDNKRANEEAAKAQNAYKNATKEFSDYVNQKGLLAPFTQEYWDLKKNIEEAGEAQENALEAVQLTRDAMEEAESYVNDYAQGYVETKKQADAAKTAIEEAGDAAKNVDGTTATINVKATGISAIKESLGKIFNSSYNVKTKPTTAYASGGFPTQGSLFLAGETAGQTEWLGNVNGKTGVVSGNEITGIAEAIYEASERETATLGNLLTKLLEKQLTISPSAGLGRVNAQSAAMYSRVTGA